MKFDVFQWSPVLIKVPQQAPLGRLWLRLSKPGALYVEAQGYEVLAGYGAEFDLKLAQPVTFRIDAAETVSAFLYTPEAVYHRPDGEVFTNPDRMVHESGAVLEVRKALRAFELEKRAILREMRAMAKSSRTNSDTTPDPEPAPEPAPEPEPQDAGA